MCIWCCYTEHSFNSTLDYSNHNLSPTVVFLLWVPVVHFFFSVGVLTTCLWGGGNLKCTSQGDSEYAWGNNCYPCNQWDKKILYSIFDISLKLFCLHNIIFQEEWYLFWNIKRYFLKGLFPKSNFPRDNFPSGESKLTISMRSILKLT